MSTDTSENQALVAEVRENLLKELSENRGDLYQRIRDEVARDLRQEGELSSEREEEATSRFSALFVESESKITQTIEQAMEEVQKSIHQSRSEWEDTHRRHLEDISHRWKEDFASQLQNLSSDTSSGESSALTNVLEKLHEDARQLGSESESLKEGFSTRLQETLTHLQDQEATLRTSLEERYRREIALLEESMDEERRLHLRSIEDMETAYKQQARILQDRVGKEREETLRAQHVFEETLRAKYEMMVESLQQSVRDEQEAQMRRALQNLEKYAKERAYLNKTEQELQAIAETRAAEKFQQLVADLRVSWEEEERERSKQLEQRLRSHYQLSINHLENQLRMALELNDEVDQRWMEDVEIRNKQQARTMRAFEEKCRRLYDTRLREYEERTDKQLSEYEQALLEVGAKGALEKAKLESQIRKLKLASSRWRVDYQRDMQRKYHDTVNMIEEKFYQEIISLHSELDEARKRIVLLENDLQSKTMEHLHGANGTPGETNPLTVTNPEESVESNNPLLSSQFIAQIEKLIKLFQGLTMNPSDQVSVLLEILGYAPLNENFIECIQSVQYKLSSRLPIYHLLTKKTSLTTKLRYLSKLDENEENEELKAQAMAEYNAVESQLNQLIMEYEENFQEPFPN